MIKRTIYTLSRKLEFGDWLLLLYIIIFVRQYLWPVNNSIAWCLTIIISALIWFYHLKTKEPPEERTPLRFWLVVAFPLLIIYMIRVVYPDISYDVLNYHLLHSERALRGFLFLDGDYFPSFPPVNPAPEMLTGLSRHVLGYRLGTFINYLVMVWTGAILYKFLRPFVGSSWLRCVSILLVLLSENLLFQINNYMVDLLAIPLLLEATYIALRFGETKSGSRDFVRLALLLGASIAFKLTNVAFVIPIMLVCLFNAKDFFKSIRLRDSFRTISFTVAAFLASLFPFSFYMYWQTRSPVFPFYNTVFKSPFSPDANVYDGRWGAKGFWETLLWPVLMSFKLERLSEIPVYSGRISVVFVIAILCLTFKTLDRRVRALCFIVIAGSILWSAATGYIRYVVYVEVVSGVLLVCIASSLLAAAKGARRRPLLKSGAWLACGILVTTSLLACSYIYRYEWSGRRTIFDSRRAYAKEFRHLLKDRSLLKFLPENDRKLFDNVGVWIVSDQLTNGVEALLKNDVPMLTVTGYFDTPRSKDKFKETLDYLNGKKMYSLCYTQNLNSAIKAINSRGLKAGEIVPVNIPFYSSNMIFNMSLIEVLRPGKKTTEALTTIINPIDQVEFFVSQQYRDFLNREADAVGSRYWQGILQNYLNRCGAADTQAAAECRTRAKAAVSEAFFVSVEYQRTGYLVYRLYITAADRETRPRGLPRYTEFIRDTKIVGRGVVVNSDGWEQELEANVRAFLREFVQRAEFVGRFPKPMTGEQYIDALYESAGLTSARREREDAIAAYGRGGVEGRAQALRSIAESKSLFLREFNKAFVLMQYFGYLRRAPDEGQDAQQPFAGYDFWLQKLNTEAGDTTRFATIDQLLEPTKRARMVEAFVVTGEYRRRFGPE